MTLFGRRLEQLRDQKQLHNKAIAQKAGLKPPEITKIIKGELQKTEKIRSVLDTLAETDDELAELIIEWILDRLLELNRGVGLIEIRKLEENPDLLEKIRVAPFPYDLKQDLFYVLEDAMKHEATRRQIRIWTELIRSQKKSWEPKSTHQTPPSGQATTTSDDAWSAVAEDPKKYESRHTDKPSDISKDC